MQVKTTKKISRSAVATVLATSSVALGLPAQTNATILFNDVKPADFFYTAVNELSEKKIVNGYGDGTFRPFNSVTRGEAAKMLALSLKLDVTNAETTQFSDVKKGDIFYKYIAALANKGIINGYPDGSFKPNEVVQRGAMAKMVALGYEFILATNITHPFKDVDQNNIFNQHIQTLVNLNITKGTSFNTFEPAKAVTRGELATFISRANKANAGKPLYVVDNIIGNKIYINSVGYTISSNVASYIKAENKSALIGAHVEGTFNGMTLTNITKLTLNATGNANSIYTFDGGNSTFNGTLVVNGSYLKFKNWTLNGQTIVSETPRKSLAQYNRISELKIASLASGVIDFTRPTSSDDGILNNGDNGSLKPGTGTSPYAPYSEKLSPIHKYVDFTNVTVRNLFVEQNRAYVAAQKEIEIVTVRRDVEFAELNFNMRNLYLEGDASLTLYGTHDIATVYKNSYYSVYFNSDSEIDTLIVDNSNGWIDLGEYVVVDKVIIPPKTTPNDIFDDYKNDNDKIGNIEDNTGKEVDRNPIENGVVPDMTPSRIEIKEPILTLSNAADVTVEVSETGKLYYLVLPVDEKPSARYIVQSGNKVDVLDSDLVSEGKYVHTFRTKDILEEEKKYYIYIVHVDDAGNFSRIADDDFTTKDGTPPYFEKFDATALYGGRRIQLDVKPNEESTFYYYMTEGSVAGNYDDDFIKNNALGTKKFDEPITEDSILITEDIYGQKVKPNTPYVIYGILIDKSGNVIRSVVTKNVETHNLDETPPFVKGPNNSPILTLEPVEAGKVNQFFMYISEKLDKKSAEIVTNYTLTGSGIINVPGQNPIHPTEVKYSDYGDGGRLLITIPSLTGFVNGDTLKVTVLEGVKDLADNPFENINNTTGDQTPRNYAQYTHEDVNAPKIENLTIINNLEGTNADVSFNATKAGFIYYMILPSGTDLEERGIKAKDFVEEFTNPSDKFNESEFDSNKIYLEGLGGLKPRKNAELGYQEFNLEYGNLRPSPYISYDLYMVLVDRSGNMSTIVSKPLISDKMPPKISGFEIYGKKIDSNENPNTEAEIKVQSDEKGTVYYRLVPKYVKNNSGDVIHNPLVYNGNNLITNIPGTENLPNTTYRMKEQKFIEYFSKPGVIAGNAPLDAGVTQIPLKGLTPFTEYVAIIAVKDTPENFTVYYENNGLMIKEFYMDNTIPKIKEGIIYKNLDEQYEITFSETIMRKYLFPYNMLINGSLQQKSILENNSILLNNLIDVQGTDATAPTTVNDFSANYSYTTGTELNSESKLTLSTANGNPIQQSFTIKMKDSVVDQSVNDNDEGYKFDPADFAEYKFRNLSLNFEDIIKKNPVDGGYQQLAVGFNFTSAGNTFPVTERFEYYYMVIPSTNGLDNAQNLALAESYTIKQVIEDATKVSSIASLHSGLGDTAVNNGRAQILLNHSVRFLDTDYIILVLEDKYGNRVKRVLQVKEGVYIN